MSDKLLWVFVILMLLDAVATYVKACKTYDCDSDELEDIDDTEVTK